MAVKYHLVQKINPTKPTDPKKYYANVVTRGEVSTRQLATEIAQISTISTADVMAVLEALLQSIPHHLKQGEIVRLGDFGSFSVKIAGKGAATEELFNTSFIEGLKLSFRPGRELKNALSNTVFEKD